MLPLESLKERCLKTGFLSRTIKLLTDPAKPSITRTHSPGSTLGKSLIALQVSIWRWGYMWYGIGIASSYSSFPWKGVWKGNSVFRFILWEDKTQPAGDASEESDRSNMRVHRCHRLHTEKEERVMLSLVRAYLARTLQCMPTLACWLHQWSGEVFCSKYFNHLTIWPRTHAQRG